MTAIATTSKLMNEKPQVLLIEGDERLRDAAASMRLDDEVHLEIIADGDAALEAVRRDQPFDLILFDIQTCAMEPRTFFRRLRRVSREIPVLLLSSHGGASLRRELGASGVVRKPLEERVLVEASRSACSSRRAVMRP